MKYSVELRAPSMAMTCFVCGQVVTPRLMRCIFRTEQTPYAMTYIVGWAHLSCVPETRCSTCLHLHADAVCYNEFAVFAGAKPHCIGCVKWEARDIRLTCVQCKIRYTHIPTLKYTTRELCAVCADLSRKGKAMPEKPQTIYIEAPDNDGVYRAYTDLTAPEIRDVPGVIYAQPIVGPVIDFRVDKRLNSLEILKEIRRRAEEKATKAEITEEMQVLQPAARIALLGYVPAVCAICGQTFDWVDGDRHDLLNGLVQSCDTCSSEFMYVEPRYLVALAKIRPGDAEALW